MTSGKAGSGAAPTLRNQVVERDPHLRRSHALKVERRLARENAPKKWRIDLSILDEAMRREIDFPPGWNSGPPPAAGAGSLALRRRMEEQAACRLIIRG